MRAAGFPSAFWGCPPSLPSLPSSSFNTRSFYSSSSCFLLLLTTRMWRSVALLLSGLFALIHGEPVRLSLSACLSFILFSGMSLQQQLKVCDFIGIGVGAVDAVKYIKFRIQSTKKKDSRRTQLKIWLTCLLAYYISGIFHNRLLIFLDAEFGWDALTGRLTSSLCAEPDERNRMSKNVNLNISSLFFPRSTSRLMCSCQGIFSPKQNRSQINWTAHIHCLFHRAALYSCVTAAEPMGAQSGRSRSWM